MSYKKIKRYFLTGFFIALVSLSYNFLVFNFFGFYPEIDLDWAFLSFFGDSYLVFIFVKNFLFGVILTWLFLHAYSYLNASSLDARKEMLGLFYIVCYAVFSLVVFSLGDILLFGSSEKMVLLFTLDGLVETTIATVPIRLLHSEMEK